jgi:protein SCO1
MISPAIDRRGALMLSLAPLILLPLSGFAQTKLTVLDHPRPVPAFVLEDQDGHRFGLAQLKGNWTLLFMGYTFCPDVCPFTLANLSAVLDAMAAHLPLGNLPRAVFLAVDPARDKPVLKAYLSNFGERFTGITGSLDAIETLVEGVGGYVRRELPDKDGNYTVVHTATISVLDPAAQVVATALPPLKPDETANQLIALMNQKPRQVDRAVKPQLDSQATR